MGLLRHHDCVIKRRHRACIDFRFGGALQGFETEHGAPENENYDKIEENDDQTDQVLGHLQFCISDRDARRGALCEHDILPVG